MNIDITERFELLPRAPIVEAVVQISARPEVAWDEKEILANLTPQLSGFELFSRQSVQHQLTLNPSNVPVVSEANLGWHGVACQSKEERVQFSRDGFLFSRLHPYQDWNHFLAESMRLWKVFLGTARPLEIQRIGLRFINKIQLPPKETNFEKYIQPYPEPPFNLELPFANFLHQDTFAVPGYPYAVTINKTFIPPNNPQIEGLNLIVDIDAFTIRPTEVNESTLLSQLAELRWLKNKAFFGSITPESLKLFR